MPLNNVRNIVLVLSGKGGVGKSSITTQLALTLSLQGHSVGVLDIDLTGPSIPRFFGIESERVRQAPRGWIPVPVHGEQALGIPSNAAGESEDNQSNGTQEQKVGPLSVMSLGFILPNRSDAVIWRGPKKTAMVRQFLSDVLWPDLDYLLIDTPPGTSDEHISLMETLLKETTNDRSMSSSGVAGAQGLPYLAGAVVVTTPQAVSISDVKKELNFCKKVKVRVLGVVENMAGFVCPHCRECTNVFSKGGGQVMANEFNVKFLGSVPIDPAFVELVETGMRPSYPEGTVIEGRDMGAREAETETNDTASSGANKDGKLIEKYTSCSLYPIFNGIVKQVVTAVEGTASA